MFQLATRSTPQRLLASRLLLKPSGAQRFLTTAPPSQRSRSWKSSATRWALAIGGVYYYNTSSVFAEQPDEAISRLDQKLQQIQESKLPTLDTIAEEKRQRLAEQQVREAAAHSERKQIQDDEAREPTSVQDLEEEADQQGAFNPETGEINWDCPCLGGMAHGPCGEEFKAAFSCFVYSNEEPKGMECIEKFKGMQDCFRQHPEMYGSELEDDEDEVEEELRSGAMEGRSESSNDKPTPIPSQPQSSQITGQRTPNDTKFVKEGYMNAGIPKVSGDEGGELVPEDMQSTPTK